MATAIVNWVTTTGGSYEIWYGKLSTVGTTSLPPTSGWIQAVGSPFNSSLGTATIAGLDDNTQYTIATRADCTSIDSIWDTNIVHKLVCPTLTAVANPLALGVASITASLAVTNIIEFETIATTMTLVLKNTSTSAIIETKVFTAPYGISPVSYTFNNLSVNTQYTAYLTIHDNITPADVVCSNQSVTTPIPVVVPPPVCTAPTFTLSNIQPTSIQVNITSTIVAGDTFDVSLDGGTTYLVTGQTSGTIIISAGISPGTQYVVVVRRHCQLGGINTSTSQTITTPNIIITGTVAMNSNTRGTLTGPQGTMYLAFNFPIPTPTALTFYFGQTVKFGCSSCVGGACSVSNGYDIFTPPAGAQNCVAFPRGDTYYGSPNSPFVVVVPAGVTTYTTGTNIRTNSPTFETGPWLSDGVPTDLYVRVLGYANTFTMVNGLNVSGVTIHNV